MELLAQLEQLYYAWLHSHGLLRSTCTSPVDSPVCCSCMALTWSKINHHTFRFFITQLFMVWKLPCMLKMIQLESSLLPVLLTLTLQSLYSNWSIQVWDFRSLRNVWLHWFEIYSKWSVEANKQTAHTCNGQCSVTSVGLAQARLKVNLKCNALFLWYIAHLKVNLKRKMLYFCGILLTSKWI